MVMSVTTQIIFPYMSDARAPAMDVHMTPQDAGMARSFWLILSALLIGVNGYSSLTNTITGSARPGRPVTFTQLSAPVRFVRGLVLMCSSGNARGGASKEYRRVVFNCDARPGNVILSKMVNS